MFFTCRHILSTSTSLPWEHIDFECRFNNWK